MRVVLNLPCQECSPTERKKHCFNCGLCKTEFIKSITYQGKEHGLCSVKCEENYYKTMEYSRYKLY